MIRQEFIGRKAEVIDSKNKNDVGIKGKIVDETKNTITIMDGKPKKLLKKNITLKLENYVIRGSALIKRPEERIRIKVKKWR